MNQGYNSNALSAQNYMPPPLTGKISTLNLATLHSEIAEKVSVTNSRLHRILDMLNGSRAEKDQGSRPSDGSILSGFSEVNTQASDNLGLLTQIEQHLGA